MKRFFRLFFLSFIGLSLFSCSGDGDDDISGGESKPLTVSRPVVSSITSSSALVSATATGSGITSRGFCYSKTANPTIKDTKVTANSSNMTVTLAGLSESTTYHVRAFAQNNYSAYLDSRFIEDASYLRLKNIQLGYNFQPRLGNGQKLGIYLYASAQNLLTITNYSGFDPEYSGYVDRGTYPSARTFTFGVKFSY